MKRPRWSLLAEPHRCSSVKCPTAAVILKETPDTGRRRYLCHWHASKARAPWRLLYGTPANGSTPDHPQGDPR